MAIIWSSGINCRRKTIHTILIVESEPALRLELTSALTEAAFKVVDASDYYEALYSLDEFKPDLAIMNVDLPLLDGWQACSWLHEAFGIPIILLGKDSSDRAWERAVQAGADFYLITPLKCPELAARAKAILRRYKKE